MADRDRNVGELDRLIRVLLGLSAAIAAGLGYAAYPLGATTAAAGLLLVAFATTCLTTAVTGTCGIYGLFGIDTCGDCADNSPVKVWDAS